MNSKKLVYKFSVMNYWLNKTRRSAWEHLSFDQEFNQVRREVEDLIIEAQSKIESVLAPKIGKAIIHEEKIK